MSKPPLHGARSSTVRGCTARHHGQHDRIVGLAASRGNAARAVTTASY